jgi:hypothetical protein
MKKQCVVAIMVLGWVLFGQGGSPAFAEMQNQVSVDQPTCCEPCHVTTNCKSPESPDRVSAFQNSKSSAAGNATDANQ